MGPVLDPGVPLSFPISPRVLEARLLGTVLPSPASSLQLEAVVERSCPTWYKCLFLPLLGSFLSFSSGHFNGEKCFLGAPTRLGGTRTTMFSPELILIHTLT